MSGAPKAMPLRAARDAGVGYGINLQKKKEKKGSSTETRPPHSPASYCDSVSGRMTLKVVCLVVCVAAAFGTTSFMTLGDWGGAAITSYDHQVRKSTEQQQLVGYLRVPVLWVDI
jgi:hypothetical protein